MGVVQCAVPFRAEKADPGWDIRWLQRVRVEVFKQAGEQVLALAHFSLASAGCLAQDNDKPVHTERLATGGAALPV